jgi:hypothetical protein
MALPNVTFLPKSELLADPVGTMRALFAPRERALALAA